MQASTKHGVQHLIVQISSTVSWGDSLWSEGTAERVSSQSIESPDITSVTIYTVPELVDMILCNQHVQRERENNNKKKSASSEPHPMTSTLTLQLLVYIQLGSIHLKMAIDYYSAVSCLF